MLQRLIIVCLLFGILGCSGGITRDKVLDYDGLIESGWDMYNQSMYDEAYQLFLSAKKFNSELPEAYIGCGWSLLKRQHT